MLAPVGQAKRGVVESSTYNAGGSAKSRNNTPEIFCVIMLEEKFL
jgi:hypothetical protein